MGLRINKRMGFGLADVKLDKNFLFNDARINAVNLENLRNLHISNYRKFFVEKYDEQTVPYSILRDMKSKSSKAPNVNDLVLSLYGEEELDGRKQGILLFQPYTTANEWSRSDDGMDYAEHQQASFLPGAVTTLRPKVTFLEYPPSPYEGNWLNTLTGEKVNAGNWHTVKQIKRDKPKDVNLVNRFASLVGFETMAEAERYIVPAAPTEVKAFAQWANVFTSEDVIFALRPMIVSYWA